MERKEYNIMYEFENTYWWYVGRRAIINNLLNKLTAKNKYRQIVDFGCGTGKNCNFLKEYGQKIIGIDNSNIALSYAKECGYDNVVLINDNMSLPFGDTTVGMLALFDVLEHLSDENRALKEIHRILEYDGLLVMT